MEHHSIQHIEQRINCICEEQIEREGETMIQCELCNNWLHCSCVDLPNTPEDLPSEYYCSNCRPKKLDKSDSAKDLLEQVDSYRITSLQELNTKKDQLMEGYSVMCKKPDPKMKMAEVVQRVLEIEDYLNKTEQVLADDREFKKYADELLIQSTSYTTNPTDIQFIELGHSLFSKLIVHNSEKMREMREFVDKMKAEHHTHFSLVAE